MLIPHTDCLVEQSATRINQQLGSFQLSVAASFMQGRTPVAAIDVESNFNRRS